MRFDDKVFLVTGGGRGIGRAIVKRLVDEGARVCVVDADRHAGLDAVREYGERASFVRADISAERDVRRAVSTCVRWGKRLDGVVNNAAIADPKVGPIEALPLAKWRKFLDVNLTGTFLVTKYAMMSEPDTEPYAACKGAIVSLTHALAMSLGPHVRVNCISPGWIATDELAPRGERKPSRLSKQDHAQHPVGRVGRPDDIAALCAWLLSDEAGFVTGQNFVADGGMTRKMIYA
jgi:NAD(P)-dependent dehydrogenase (short-subunit alcohol dehydrogenase family)